MSLFFYDPTVDAGGSGTRSGTIASSRGLPLCALSGRSCRGDMHGGLALLDLDPEHSL
jgi:hypothetical protein